MELQEDLRRRGAIGAADHVQLPVAERRPHSVEVVHRHPRPVLGHVGVVPFRSPGAALVDEQENVVIHAQQRQLLVPYGHLVCGCAPRPALNVRDRVWSGRLRERRQDDDMEPDRVSVRLCAILRRRRCRSGRQSPPPRTAWRPRVPRLAPIERSVDAEADADGSHQADQKPHHPPARPCRTCDADAHP